MDNYCPLESQDLLTDRERRHNLKSTKLSHQLKSNADTKVDNTYKELRKIVSDLITKGNYQVSIYIARSNDMPSEIHCSAIKSKYYNVRWNGHYEGFNDPLFRKNLVNRFNQEGLKSQILDVDGEQNNSRIHTGVVFICDVVDSQKCTIM